MQTCIATVLEGKRKRQKCQFPPSENSFCNRHQRNYAYSQLVKDNKIPCRFFFRGCNTIVQTQGACERCKSKLSKKTIQCSHDMCKFKTTGDTYCKKHSRDIYRDEEKEKKIKYCDIDRGCFTLCKDGYTKCDVCRDKSYSREKELREELIKTHNAIATMTTSKTQVCINCGKDYEQFQTRYNKPSKICKTCNNYNTVQDNKRIGRIRNYRNERYRNISQFYKDYILSAKNRNYTMALEFNDFKTMVLSECYYCQYIKEGEVNGIDRLNNSIGYEKDNCVPCCETCNMMKHTFHPIFFIELSRIISGFETPSSDFYIKWKQYYISRPRCYSKYKKHAEVTRNLPFHITKEEWTNLIEQPCYLCGFQSDEGIGLDRVDSTKREYTLDNVKPCCYTCNIVKKDFTFKQLQEQATLISCIWTDTPSLESIPI